MTKFSHQNKYKGSLPFSFFKSKIVLTKNSFEVKKNSFVFEQSLFRMLWNTHAKPAFNLHYNEYGKSIASLMGKSSQSRK